MATRVILIPDIPVIVKNQAKKCVLGVHGTPIFLLDYLSKAENGLKHSGTFHAPTELEYA